MRIIARRLPGRSRALIAGLALATAMSACNRPRTGGPDAEPDPDQAKPPPASPDAIATESQTAHLDPLTSAPWLGHADDGALVQIEFFAGADPSNAICRSQVKTANGNARTEKSRFEADPELAKITWDSGKSSASYLPESKSLDAVVASSVGRHHAILQQVTAAARPELASFRPSVPDDARSRKVRDDFVASLGKGAGWWQSGTSWDGLVTPDEPIAAGAEHSALIRPAGKSQPKVPELTPGGSFRVPLVCLLPPGSALGEADSTVGIVTELQIAGGGHSAWILNQLNPGAAIQEFDAYWVHRKSEPIPAGPATLYVYLVRTRPEGTTRAAEIGKPISNLLKLQIELAGTPIPAAEQPE